MHKWNLSSFCPRPCQDARSNITLPPTQSIKHGLQRWKLTFSQVASFSFNLQPPDQFRWWLFVNCQITLWHYIYLVFICCVGGAEENNKLHGIWAVEMTPLARVRLYCSDLDVRLTIRIVPALLFESKFMKLDLSVVAILVISLLRGRRHLALHFELYGLVIIGVRHI